MALTKRDAELTRYGHDIQWVNGNYESEMLPDEEGEYVLYDAHSKLLAERDAEIERLKEEIARGSGRRKHTHEWYERHYGKLHDWARTVLPEEYRQQFFNCVANGTYGHDDLGKPYKAVGGFIVTPGGYFKMDTAQEQILFDQCVRAEDAEAQLAAQTALVERLRTALEKMCSDVNRSDYHARRTAFEQARAALVATRAQEPQKESAS